MLRISLILSLICYGSIVFLVRDRGIVYAPIFGFGLVSCWRCNLSYIYGLEIIESRLQSLIGSFFQVMDSVTLLFSTVFYLSVS
jgi:hypothetical protein